MACDAGLDPEGAAVDDLTRRPYVSRQHGPLVPSRRQPADLRSPHGVRRPVRVEAVIERPPAPPWTGDLPYPEPVESWPGTLLDWRWTDKESRTWTALVQYMRDGLAYLHWVSGEILDVEPENEEAAPIA